jgi:hypothetical protein
MMGEVMTNLLKMACLVICRRSLVKIRLEEIKLFSERY